MIYYRINREQRLVTLLSTGGPTLAEWQATLCGMIAGCPEVLTFDSISDGRRAGAIMSAAQVRELVSLNKEMGVQDHPRRAVHLIARKVVFGVSRMYELMAEGDSAVSRLTTESVEKAAEWLGRPVEVVRAELDALAEQGPDDGS